MTNNEWIKRRKQNIRETAVQIAKEIRLSNMKSSNSNRDIEENEDEHVSTVFAEEVIESASMIEQYIEKGEKVYKDEG